MTDKQTLIFVGIAVVGLAITVYAVGQSIKQKEQDIIDGGVGGLVFGQSGNTADTPESSAATNEQLTFAERFGQAWGYLF